MPGPSDPDRVHAASLTLRYDDPESAAAVADAVAVEEGEIDDDRSRATVARDGAAVTVAVDARDRVALRAGLNTWARLVDVAEASLGVARDDDR